MPKSARVRSLILFFLLGCLFAAEEPEPVPILVTRAEIPEIVWIEFQLTTVNIDNKDIKTVQLYQEFEFKKWEKIYKILTQKELNTFDKKTKSLKVDPVILYIQIL